MQNVQNAQKRNTWSVYYNRLQNGQRMQMGAVTIKRQGDRLLMKSSKDGDYSEVYAPESRPNPLQAPNYAVAQSSRSRPSAEQARDNRRDALSALEGGTHTPTLQALEGGGIHTQAERGLADYVVERARAAFRAKYKQEPTDADVMALINNPAWNDYLSAGYNSSKR